MLGLHVISVACIHSFVAVACIIHKVCVILGAWSPSKPGLRASSRVRGASVGLISRVLERLMTFLAELSVARVTNNGDTVTSRLASMLLKAGDLDQVLHISTIVASTWINTHLLGVIATSLVLHHLLLEVVRHLHIA